MATYDELIAACKSAIETGIDQPGSVTAAGRSVTYRNLKDLADTIKKLESLNSTGDVRSHFRIGAIKSTGVSR